MKASERVVAVFGDVHGHLRLLFQLCRLWQLEHGRHLDGILQCGDLGFFPEPARLDDATARIALENPEELGFARWFRWPEPLEVDARLESWLLGPPDSLETIRVPLVFCHGNHEDWVELEQAVGGQESAAVDAYGKVVYLRSGAIRRVAGLLVAAIGGGPEWAATPSRGEHRSGRQRSRAEAWRTVSAAACDALRARGTRFDVLISHVAPRGETGEASHAGSSELRRLVEDCQPRYHFFAHHRRPIPPFRLGACWCYWLQDVGFKHQGPGAYGPVHPGCMGILRWRSPTDHEFALVDEAWLGRVNFSNWRDL